MVKSKKLQVKKNWKRSGNQDVVFQTCFIVGYSSNKIIFPGTMVFAQHNIWHFKKYSQNLYTSLNQLLKWD